MQSIIIRFRAKIIDIIPWVHKEIVYYDPKPESLSQGIKHSGRGSYTIFLDLQPKVRSKPSFVGGRGKSARLLQNRGKSEVFAGRGGY